MIKPLKVLKTMNKQKQLDLMKAYEVLRLRLSSKFNMPWPLEFTKSIHGYLCCNDVCIHAIDRYHNVQYIHANLQYFSKPVNQKSSRLTHEYGTACVLNYSKYYDIYFYYGSIKLIKLLDAGETLESLCIEYDLNHP